MTNNRDESGRMDGLFAGSPPPGGLSEEEASKDTFFVRVAEIAEAMIARHGKDFAMGTLVLSARFIAEGKPLIKREVGATTKLS